jgi:TetR/AcrR family transcriptional regulator, ethionamide resistance regulator
VRKALEGIGSVYAEHGLVLGAIADAAGHDSDVEATYRGLILRFVDVTTTRIEKDIAQGHTRALDARETARALVWMSERYLHESLGRLPRTPVETAVVTLVTVWVRALY